MTSSLSSAAAAACCKRGGGSSSSNPPPPPVARVISSSRRKVVLLLSAAAVVPAGAGAGQASTPYSQSQSQQQFGLDAKGRIRACPSTNPGCVSTNPTVGASCSLASPLIVPANTNTMPDKAAAAAVSNHAYIDLITPLNYSIYIYAY
uniref:Uncharacterized protein n=1 Tax=Oryza brachyantha TaxID=4533 RepID=J3KVL0_ORYBR